MGGKEYKGGVGRVLLRPPTAEEVVESEKAPKLDLNAQDALVAGHPVYEANKSILQPGKNLVTNLEAEAEHTIVGKDAESKLQQVISLLKQVAGNPAEIRHREGDRRERGAAQVHRHVPRCDLQRQEPGPVSDVPAEHDRDAPAAQAEDEDPEG